MSPEPGKAKLCREREQLSEALLAATTVHTALERGEGPRPRISLETARLNWHNAREAYSKHLEEHG